jgi:hypothetical protein
LVLTAIVVVWALAIAMGSPISLVFAFPVTALILRGVWSKGWVVPSDRAVRASIRDHLPEGPVSSWLWDRDEVARTVVGALIAMVLVGIVMMVDDPIVKFVAITTGVVTAGYLAFQKLGGSR